MRYPGIVFSLALLLPALTLAQIDPALNSFGLYFDTGGEVNCVDATPGVPVTGWVTITNPKLACVNGWGFGVSYAPIDGVIVDYVPTGGGIWIPDYPQGHWTVGGLDFTGAPAVQVLEVTILPLSFEPVFFYLGPYAGQQPPPLKNPGYYCGEWNLMADWEFLTPSSGDYTLPVGCINCDCGGVIPNRGVTWGSLKALFR